MGEKPHFWSSLPGILTGAAALLTAASGLFIATRQPSAPAPLSPPASVALRTAVINDPDGFVNIRTGPGANTAIAGVINAGEVFTVTPGDTAWWLVRTNRGVTGYVHKSRIALQS